ncbi:MAG: hypothetical protein VR67_06440 [Peptococcaceae bacterium BRH_c8a]|nr:MAG: hypothetical protein VR67_06440 [Peptococcaceae bacterium BRH_c8a]
MKAVVKKKPTGNFFFSTTARSILCVGLTLVYLVGAFINIPYINNVLSIVSLTCLMVCMPIIKNNARVVASTLFIVGAAILVYDGAGFETWRTGLIYNVNLIALLLLVPVFGMPLKYGGYYGVLDALVGRYMNNRNRIYWVPALLTHFFGALMNMGAMPVVYQLIVRGKLPRAFNSVPASILRGFSSSIYWSPNMISVGVVTYYLGISWAEFARYGIFLTVISLVVGWLVHIFANKKSSVQLSLSSRNDQIDIKKLAELIIFCTAFIGTIIYIATRTSIPVLDAVPLVALVYPVIWLGVLGRGKAIPPAYTEYVQNVLPRFTSEIVIFMGAGFAATALLSSNAGNKVSVLISSIGFPNEYFLCLGILASIVLLGVLGVTPMVTVMAYGAALQPALLGLTPIQLALVLVGGWATSVIISPFTGVTLIMSGLAQKSPFEIVRANWPFTVLMVLLIAALPSLINYFSL